jgi:hypothetical protein
LQIQPSTVDVLSPPNPINILQAIAETKGLEALSVEYLIQSLAVDDNHACVIEELMRGQSSSSFWHQTCLMRITASNFGIVCHPRQKLIPPSALPWFLGDVDISNIPAV